MTVVENLSQPSPIKIMFKHGNKLTNTVGQISQTLLSLAHQNNIPLEGACEGNLACSTCHVYCPKDLFIKNDNGNVFFKTGINTIEKISDAENDLLDKVYKVQDNSRLGCQIKINKFLNDKVFEIPKATINMAVDGYIPKPH